MKRRKEKELFEEHKPVNVRNYEAEDLLENGWYEQ